MQRVLPCAQSLPLFGTPATRAIEQRASAALEPHALMRRAGEAVARLGLALAPHASNIWVAAGPGNNGGDGLDAAIHWRAAGKTVHVTLDGDPAKLPDDARDALARAQAAGVTIAVGGAMPPVPIDLAIDALLGIGATRAPEGALAARIDELNQRHHPVLAIDVPSGLDAGSGRVLGAQAVRATHTLTLLTLKPGLFTAQGRDHAGEVWFDAIGVDGGADSPDGWLTGAEIGRTAARAHAQHKGSFGDVAVVGGAPGMGGAALLAARAALHAGAGRVYVNMLDERAMTVDPTAPELMFRPAWWKSDASLLHASTVVCGCGGGDAVREPLARVLSAAGRLVLDADALNAIAQDSALQALLTARGGRGQPTVLTPHPLEAARLLGSDAARVQVDRLGAAQALTERFACVVVLKGSGSVIAAPGEAPRINSTGDASLATAGTGDVLAGWLGGLWSQQRDADSLGQAAAVAACAVYQHGAAAEAAQRRVVPAGDLIDRLAAWR